MTTVAAEFRITVPRPADPVRLDAQRGIARRAPDPVGGVVRVGVANASARLLAHQVVGAPVEGQRIVIHPAGSVEIDDNAVERDGAAGVEGPSFADPAGLLFFAHTAGTVGGGAVVVQRQRRAQTARACGNLERIRIGRRTDEGADLPPLERGQAGFGGRTAESDVLPNSLPFQQIDRYHTLGRMGHAPAKHAPAITNVLAVSFQEFMQCRLRRSGGTATCKTVDRRDCAPHTVMRAGRPRTRHAHGSIMLHFTRVRMSLSPLASCLSPLASRLAPRTLHL